MKLVFTCFISFCLLTACKKDEVNSTQNIPKFYIGNKVKNVQPVQLYTKNGIITSSSIVQAYSNEFDRYLFDESTPLNDPEFKRFRYISEDSLFVTGVALPTGLKRVQTDVYDIFASGYKDILLDTTSMFLSIQKYKRYEPKLATNGSTHFETDLPVYILKKRNDTLFFPMIRYVFVSRQPGSATLIADRLNNVFKPSGASRLGLLDTLLVQQFELALSKE